jgi:secondary thiamine-phosphate synthase enzyme
MVELKVNTSQRVEFKDITTIIQNVVSEQHWENGVITIFVPHTTAGITINENSDPDVVRDMTKTINQLIPFENDYKHYEGNSAAHIKASLFGNSTSVVVADNQLVLGTWQAIYFSEFDGARTRKVIVEFSESKQN